MTEFYKEKFNKFYSMQMATMKKDNLELWKTHQKQGGLASMSKLEMDQLVEKFISYTFGKDILKEHLIGKIEIRQLVNSMLMIVFSHRYSKGDKFIIEAEAEPDTLVDFTVVRDVMYKYSKKAQDRFFALPIEAFLFSAFALSDEGMVFLMSKPDNISDPTKLRRLQIDLADLKNQSVESL